MKVKKFFEELAFLFDVNVSELNEMTDFRTMENYNSLVAIGIVSMIEENTGVNLDIWKLRNLKNIGELMDLMGRGKFEE